MEPERDSFSLRALPLPTGTCACDSSALPGVAPALRRADTRAGFRAEQPRRKEGEGGESLRKPLEATVVRETHAAAAAPGTRFMLVMAGRRRPRRPAAAVGLARSSTRIKACVWAIAAGGRLSATAGIRGPANAGLWVAAAQRSCTKVRLCTQSGVTETRRTVGSHATWVFCTPKSSPPRAAADRPSAAVDLHATAECSPSAASHGRARPI